MTTSFFSHSLLSEKQHDLCGLSLSLLKLYPNKEASQNVSFEHLDVGCMEIYYYGYPPLVCVPL